MPLSGRNNYFTGLGASTVAATGVAGLSEGDGFMHYVWHGQNVDGRLLYSPNQAGGSENLLTTLGRVPNYDTYQSTYGHTPGNAVVLCGANDMDGVQASGGATAMSRYGDILDALLGRDILPWIVAIPPADDTTQMKARAWYNTGLALKANKRGLPYINPVRFVVDQTSGGLASPYDGGDGLHFAPIGAKVYGDYVADRILNGGPRYPWEPPLIEDNGTNTDDAYHLTSGNGLFLTDTNADGVPDGVTVSSNPDAGSTTYALASAASDGISGNWFKITKSATTGDTILSIATNAVTALRWFAVGWAYVWDYSSGTPNGYKVEVRKQDGTNIFIVDGRATQDVPVTKVWHVFQAPSGTTSFQFRIRLDAIGTFQIGQVTLMDLTAAGIAGEI